MKKISELKATNQRKQRITGDTKRQGNSTLLLETSKEHGPYNT
jgi:hypothetical protein